MFPYSSLHSILWIWLSGVWILLKKVKQIETSAFQVCKLRVSSQVEAVQAM
jgi:hypothetical protein